MLGGKLDALWDEMPGADFNIACDPYAVDAVMRTGLPLRFVPLNATWPIALTLEEVEALEPQTPLARQARELMIAHCRHFAPEPMFRFHDPSVLLAARAPDAYAPRRLAVNLDEESPDFGRLIDSPHGTLCDVYPENPETTAAFKTALLATLGLTPPP